MFEMSFGKRNGFKYSWTSRISHFAMIFGMSNFLTCCKIHADKTSENNTGQLLLTLLIIEVN